MYNYTTERPFVFTEEGQAQFLRIRDRIQRLIKLSGAVRCQEAMQGETGSSWQILACVDRVLELKEIREITGANVCGQHCVFVSGNYDA